MIGIKRIERHGSGKVEDSGDQTCIGVEQASINNNEDRNDRDDTGHEEERAHDTFAAQALAGKNSRQEERHSHFEWD